MKTDTLTIVSLMADNARPTYRRIAGYLSARAGICAELVEGVPWQTQGHMLDQGEADAGFVCGLIYTRKAAQLEPLVAPVLRAARYDGRPIYYSDVIVRSDSHFHSFDDLRGATWAYNEPGSFSGYAVVRAHLAERGEDAGYFARWVESGGHLRSIALVAAGGVDASAIDSVVLELELRQRPELAAQLRVIAQIGPSTIPPFVIARRVPAELRQRLRSALLRMHEDDQGRAILSEGMIARFVAVDDASYDDVRRKALSAEEVQMENAHE